MSSCRTLEGLNGKMCELLHTSLVVQKMQRGQKTRGIGDHLGSGHVRNGKGPSRWTARASWQSGTKRRVQPFPLCNICWEDLGPNIPWSLCPRFGFCSSKNLLVEPGHQNF